MTYVPPGDSAPARRPVPVARVTGPWPLRPAWTAGAAELAALKQGRRVAVVVPAKDEERTVAGVVTGVVEDLLRGAGLVDEVLVVDGRSVDATADAARDAGARVLTLPASAHGHALPGKGGALWWAQLQTDADLLVFLDADVSPSFPDTVVQLLAPLLVEPDVSFVKAAFDRPLTVDGLLHAGSGGRVTELLTRPLLNAWWPELAGFVQPLAGEVALRRELCEDLPFSIGYGLELGMLLDVLDRVGAAGMAQVDIGERVHRHHSDAAVGRMAAGVLAVALARTGAGRRSEELVQFVRSAGVLVASTTEVPVGQLPPALTLPGRRRADRAS